MFMRTLASTFSTRNEADAACRRLEAIGIPRDRVVLKEVATATGPSAGSGTNGGVFVSVKVTTDQAGPVGEILRGAAQGGNAEPAHALPEREAVQSFESDAPQSSRPLPGALREREVIAAPIDPVPSQHPGVASTVTQRDHAQIGRFVVYCCLIILAAFVIGALLGLIA
jgi:hypothetical protein